MTQLDESETGSGRVVLSTGFLFALSVSCVETSLLPIGFERRVDAAIYRSASRAKTRTQSSKQGVVAKGKWDHLKARRRTIHSDWI